MTDLFLTYTSEQRSRPLDYAAFAPTGRVRITAPRVDLAGPVTVHAHGKSDEDVAAAVFAFSFWWRETIYPRLNGFAGFDCITWKVLR